MSNAHTAPEPGRVGLANLGNSCYMNSVAQVLARAPGLEAALARAAGAPGMDAMLAREWLALRAAMAGCADGAVVAPRRFLGAVRAAAAARGNEAFARPGQSDAAEFLQFFLECAHAGIARGVAARVVGTPRGDLDELARRCYAAQCATYAREYSELMPLFYGISASILERPADGAVRAVAPEMYSSVDMPIPEGARSLAECFAAFVRPELLEGANAWRAEAGGAPEAVFKRAAFWSFPEVLVVVLKRFSACGRRKNCAAVEFPVAGLDLAPYACGYRRESFVYDLFGVCEHHGGVQGGHYTALARAADGRWRRFDDDAVVDADPRALASPAAYVLFYKKNSRL